MTCLAYFCILRGLVLSLFLHFTEYNFTCGAKPAFGVNFIDNNGKYFYIYIIQSLPLLMARNGFHVLWSSIWATHELLGCPREVSNFSSLWSHPKPVFCGSDVPWASARDVVCHNPFMKVLQYWIQMPPTYSKYNWQSPPEEEEDLTSRKPFHEPSLYSLNLGQIHELIFKSVESLPFSDALL